MELLGGFVNPGLAIGAALAAVPLLIHLLNRQRHKPMPWAAMRFVLAAVRRTRRRTRLENLLLLLLRMGAIALLALAVARPFTGAESPLAGLTESRRDVVLVLDGSASTGYRREVRSVFEDVVDRARRIVLELDGGRGDRARLVLAGAQPRLLSWRSPEEAFSLLGTLTEPSDEVLDLAAALGEVAGYAEEDAPEGTRSELEVHLLTDLQRNAFVPPAEAAAGEPGVETPRLVEQLERLAVRGVRVLVQDLGTPEPVPSNLGVVAVEPAGQLLGPLAPVDIAVRVRNFGPGARAGVRVTLDVDGERRPSKLLDLPARGEARALFSVAFKSSGPHVLHARVESDRLPVDDERVAIVHVPAPVRVLLVDGEPSYQIDASETGVLGAVLEPAPADDAGFLGAPAPFDVRTIDGPALRDADLEAYDVIVLANVRSLAEPVVERLEERVAEGAALILTAGANLEAGRDSWNARLHRADGSGLLPAFLGGSISVPDRRSSYFRIGDFDALHPALAFFADLAWRPLLTEVPIYTFLGARPLESARVLARLDDEQKSPLLVERSYDRGKVLLWLTTIDNAWARVAESPRTLVPLAHELVRYAGTPSLPRRNVPVGGPLSAEVASFPRAASVLRPDGSRRSLEGEPEAAGPGRWRLPAYEDTGRAGLYRIESEGAPTVPFAVRIEPREGDLERLAPNELGQLHPALVLHSGADEGEPDELDAPRRGEMWRRIALACFVFLVLETLWAAWVGRRRRIG